VREIKTHAGVQSVFLQTVLLLITAAMLFSGCKKAEVVEEVEVIRPVKIMTVQAGTETIQHGFPGKVRASIRSELSFKVSGPLVALPVDEGQHVKKGDLIAQIQQRDFQTALNEAKARNLEAEKQFRRYKELYAKKQVSKAEYDGKRANRDVARAQLADAVNSLKDTSLKAPFDGIISRRFVENFQKVQAKEPIANLQDITRIEILINVPEQLMAALKEYEDGYEISATFETIPDKEFSLEVKEYSTQADPATQTYQVVLIMDQPDEATILPGMTAMVVAKAVQVETGGKTTLQAIVIPAIAVMDAPGDHPFVWIYNKETSTAHKVEVVVGSMQGSADILIKEGLKGGDVVIIAGITQLAEGMKVRPWEKQREGK
jgi:RND family efflux transporter MFP subunit